MTDPRPPNLLPLPGQLNAYAEAGWKFVLLHHWSETKQLPNGKILELGKAPIGKKWTKQGVNLDAAIAHMNSGKNVGALIPEDWAVLDIDPRNFPPGRHVLKEFCAKMGFDFGQLPVVRTGSGGLHGFVRLPSDYHGSVKHSDWPGIEFKQIGSQVVTAGSIHPKSRSHYKWRDGNTVGMKDAPLIAQTILDAYVLKIPNLAPGTNSSSWNTLTDEQIIAALDKLDVTEFRDQDSWFGLMCSIHWLSGGQGREQWVEWSTSDPKFEDHREIIEMRWDSLDRDTDSNALVAKGGLLFKALKAKGEDPGAPEWQRQPDKDFEDYDDQESQEDEALIKLRHQQATDKAVKTEGGMIASMNERHFVLDHKGKTVVGRIREEQDSQDSMMTVYTFSDVTSFKNYYANQTMRAGNEVVPLADWWFHHPQRLTYSKMEFRPDKTPGAYRDMHGLVLNQWTGWAIKPKPADWSLFRELIEDAVCGQDQDKINYIFNWFAASYQRIGRQIGTALAINGLKGTGKTTLWEVFSAPFGTNHSMATSRMSEVFGDFNGRMMGKAALLVEEALFAGSKQANGMLKDLITGNHVSINEKFLPSYTQRNYFRILIFTNNDHIVEATEDERRFFVTKVLPTYRERRDFWDSLRKQMFEDGGVAGFFHDMLQRDITGFDAYADVPRTKELIEQINITRGAVLDWLTERLDFGQDQFNYAWVNRKNEFILPIYEMWNDFASWQKGQTHARYENPIRSQSAFSREIKRIFEGLELTTASVPDNLAEFEIKSNPQTISGRVYKVAKVYKFHNYQEFDTSFRSRYGMESMVYDPTFDELLTSDEEWDIL